MASTAARIVGLGMTPLSQGASTCPVPSPIQLMVQALHMALSDAHLDASEVDAIIALPPLMGNSFMVAHSIASEAGMLPRRGFVARTLDVGGAGPIAGVLAAAHMVQCEGKRAVAVVTGDTVGSASTQEFLARADATVSQAAAESGVACATALMPTVPSPVIPNLYDKVARWQMQQHGVTREQLAMCASLMTWQASRHPAALRRKPLSVEEVLAAALVAPVTSRLECAKPADGGAAVIVASSELTASNIARAARAVNICGGGEASGPLVPSVAGPCAATAEDALSAASEAAVRAYTAAACAPSDIDYWGIYDCFPVCFIRGLEAVGLAAPGMGGDYVERAYLQHFPGAAKRAGQQDPGPAVVWPVNTHGGLLGLGAPWEVPAMHSLVEAVAQLRGEADGRQVAGARRALVYGNGGVFSHAAVVVLASSSAHGSATCVAGVAEQAKAKL